MLGANGWFGRSLSSLIDSETPIMRIGRVARTDSFAWNFDEVKDFSPTAVFNFAFITREKLDLYGLSEYEQVNLQLLAHFEQAMTLQSVRMGMTISSGAAITESDKPYGKLKVLEEELALSLATSKRIVVVPRVYSVSGPFVRNPEAYAFSSFIQQAHNGQIRITAQRPTYRRYVDVCDLLRVGISRMDAGLSGVFESGGELVEMYELATRIAASAGENIPIVRDEIIDLTPSIYASDNQEWIAACRGANFTPRNLDEQIDRVVRGLSDQGQ